MFMQQNTELPLIVVEFNDSHIEAAEKALSEVEEVVRWLHEPMNGKLQYPSFVGKKEKEIMESSWWFWDLLLQRIKEKGALPPTCVTKYVVQSLYNKMKPGVDGVLTQYAAFFCSQTSKLQWEQNVGTKRLKRAFTASFIACPLQKRREDIYNHKKYDGLEEVATQVKRNHDNRRIYQRYSRQTASMGGGADACKQESTRCQSSQSTRECTRLGVHQKEGSRGKRDSKYRKIE
jgi:hypothetical protein